MIDGINICVILKEWQALNLILTLDLQPASKQGITETKFNYFGNLRNLLIEVGYKNSEYVLSVRGSIHKYVHGNNKSDFYTSELFIAIKKIYKHFNIMAVEVGKRGQLQPAAQITLSTCRVEVGANIEVGIDELDTFCQLNFIQHKMKPFKKDPGDGLAYRASHENYQLKIYPKGDNLLRIEMVFLTGELEKYGVKSFADINEARLRRMADRLKLEFREIIFADGIDIYSAEHLTTREELKLLRYTSDWRKNQYYANLKKAEGKGKKNMQQRMWRLGDGSKKILKEKGAGYKEILAELLAEKLEMLFN